MAGARRSTASTCAAASTNAARWCAANSRWVAATAWPSAPPGSAPPRSCAEMAAAWTLYLLECMDGSLYAGITNDLERRYAMHAAGKGARYTRSHPPRRIVASQLKRLDVEGKRAFSRAHPYPG